jgi:hypothetical protein
MATSAAPDCAAVDRSQLGSVVAVTMAIQYGHGINAPV